MGASVKVMLSYDYCHFEVCKSSDEPLTNEQIDAMRKDCIRLADKAVKQYRIAKNSMTTKAHRRDELCSLRNEVVRIEAKAEGDRTPNEMAKMKLLKDRDWEAYIAERYDYQDDWREEDDE